MTRNVGSLDRIFRGLGALAMLACAIFAPVPLVLRTALFGTMGAYLLFTALAGTCLGYRLMGRSTCPLEEKGA